MWNWRVALFVCISLTVVSDSGTFGEMRWAIWRQTALMQSGDVDVEEDEAVGDEAVIVKTLKTNADRRHFEKFLNEALVYYRVPEHPNLAQV
jgi:hypothetical protein